MKALIIQEPWIGKILRGEKTWEMRKTVCHFRGRIGLIRKGSGLVVGVADVVDSLCPIQTMNAYAEVERLHAVPPDQQQQGFAGGWTTPWVLAHTRALPLPVPYQHPSGAVIWVNLTEAVAAVVSAQLGGTNYMPDTSVTAAPISRTAAPNKVNELLSPSSSNPDGPSALRSVDTRRVVVTLGGIRNNYIYLPLEFFPDDAMGGRTKAEAARRKISVTFQPGETVETDIDRGKRILRTRGPIGDFLARACLEAGDTVLITRASAYAYTFSKARHA